MVLLVNAADKDFEVCAGGCGYLIYGSMDMCAA
jgi:hypothetical protein